MSTTVGAGQSAVSSIVGNGDTLTVLGGGTTTATQVLSGGTELLSSGGYSYSATISSGGVEFVSGGIAVAIDTAVSAGGALVSLQNGDIANAPGPGLVVSSRVVLWTIGSGATSLTSPVVNQAVASGAVLYVLPGGVANATQVSGGGTIEIYDGQANGTTLSAATGPAVENVRELGFDLGPNVLANGELNVFDDGHVLAARVSAGGTATVYGGGGLSSATIAGGTLSVPRAEPDGVNDTVVAEL